MFAKKPKQTMMRKLTLLLIFLLSVAALFSQVTRDKVVVEVGTGTWCTYCPGAAMGVDDLIEEGWPVAAIENHNGDPFANVYSNARNSYYGITGYPTAFFDGGNPVVGGSHTESMYDSYWPKVQARMAVPSPVTIDVYGSHTGLTYNVTVTVTKVSTINGSNPRLHLCITESHIVYAWQGMSEVNYVNRLMVPDQNGTELDFSESDVLEIPLTFNLQATWVLSQLELVAFVQTNSNKEIHNGYKVKLAWMAPPPPPLAAAFSSDTSTCETYQVQYTDMSAGNPTAWYWEFPGGTPDTSRNQNPLITYNTAGKYDVSLVVTKNDEADTTLMSDYLDVYELPEVTFDVMEQECVNYPPVELTQGIPAGGIYSGPGVTDGFFYPDVAGIGTHTLVYTYTDENGCAKSAEQTMVVDACTGLPENGDVQIVTLPNPTQGSFRLAVSNMEDVVSIRIINSTGKTVYQQSGIQISGNYNSTIDLTGNSSGIYYLQIEGKKSNYFKKIILQD
jgi:PKD repeat protein